jgi:Na+/H+-dicarboxylate symporter
MGFIPLYLMNKENVLLLVVISLLMGIELSTVNEQQEIERNLDIIEQK